MEIVSPSQPSRGLIVTLGFLAACIAGCVFSVAALLAGTSFRVPAHQELVWLVSFVLAIAVYFGVGVALSRIHASLSAGFFSGPFVALSLLIAYSQVADYNDRRIAAAFPSNGSPTFSKPHSMFELAGRMDYWLYRDYGIEVWPDLLQTHTIQFNDSGKLMAIRGGSGDVCWKNENVLLNLRLMDARVFGGGPTDLCAVTVAPQPKADAIVVISSGHEKSYLPPGSIKTPGPYYAMIGERMGGTFTLRTKIAHDYSLKKTLPFVEACDNVDTTKAAACMATGIKPRPFRDRKSPDPNLVLSIVTPLLSHDAEQIRVMAAKLANAAKLDLAGRK